MYYKQYVFFQIRTSASISLHFIILPELHYKQVYTQVNLESHLSQPNCSFL